MDRDSLPNAIKATHEVLYMVTTALKVPKGDRTVEELLTPVLPAHRDYIRRLQAEGKVRRSVHVVSQVGSPHCTVRTV